MLFNGEGSIWALSLIWAFSSAGESSGLINRVSPGFKSQKAHQNYI